MNAPAINVTDSAAKRLNEIAGADPAAGMLRITVEGGGCSGFQYRFDLVGDRQPDDVVFERAGARVLVDPLSLPYLAGSEIDFVDDLLGATFRIRNPNATSSCGCGTSFAL